MAFKIPPRLVKGFQDAGIGLAGIILTILFDFATLGFVDPNRLKELQENQNKLLEFLAVPFDLWLISFSLLLGALLTCDQKDRGKLAPPFAWGAAALIMILASLAVSSVFPSFHQNLFKIYIPDVLGFALIAVAAHSAGVGDVGTKA